jgi:putative sterol carrier protein
MSIDDAEASLRGSLAAFSRLGKVVKFDCGPDGVIVIDARGGDATVSRDDVAGADCTLDVSAADLEQILAHELDPTAAFMNGRLRIKGDMGVAMQLASILG